MHNSHEDSFDLSKHSLSWLVHARATHQNGITGSHWEMLRYAILVMQNYQIPTTAIYSDIYSLYLLMPRLVFIRAAYLHF